MSNSKLNRRNNRECGVPAVVRSLLYLAAAAAAVAAQAQVAPTTDAAKDGDEVLEEATITGSRIARSGYDQPTPVTVIGEDDLAQAGTPNISDFVNELPAVMGSAQPSTGNRSTFFSFEKRTMA